MVTGVEDATDNGKVEAGEFSAWLATMQAALSGEGGSDTPCGDCAACCSTGHFVHVRPAERETLASIPDRLMFPAPGEPPGHVVLPHDERGRCPMLSRGGRCTIYEHRPRTCRVYDCRVFAAAGIPADREAITQRAVRWQFTFAGDRARAEHDAVRAVLRFVRDHADAFPGAAVPEDPTQLAVLAVIAVGVFLDGAGAAGSGASAADVARAVVDAARSARRADEDGGEATGPRASA